LAKLNDCNDSASANLVIENILDENGLVNDTIDLEKMHTTTYINFLHALKFDGKLVCSRPVHKFNYALENSLNNMTLSQHACILGGIEHFYIEISKMISEQLKRQHDVKQDHYSVHEILDQKHAMDFFQVAINQKATIGDMEFGIVSGYDLLWDVYNNMNTD
jgi:hypothetical protein